MQNYFVLLGMQTGFDISLQELEKKWQLAVASCHPDKFVTDPLQYQQAISMTSVLHNAYETLQNPVTRAHHLLFVQGIDREKYRIVYDNAFLFEQMQWREKIEQFTKKIHADTISSENDIKKTLQTKIALQVKEISEGFLCKLPPDTMFVMIDKLQFWQKLIANIN